MKRSRCRRTSVLVDLVTEELDGCDCCCRVGEFVFVEEVCSRLGLHRLETDRVVRWLSCPTCEAGPHLYYLVVQKDADERHLLRRAALRWDMWQRRYSAQLADFADHLVRYPHLALDHPAARALERAVARAPVTLIDRNPWFRGRAIKTECSPRCEDFLAPDPRRHDVPAGRFNHAGQRSLYVCATPDTVAAEHRIEEPGELWIAALNLPPVHVLDLSPWGLRPGLLLAGLEVSRFRDPSDKAPREYLIPRFIADLVRRRRSVDGIFYASSRERTTMLWADEPRGRNLVLLSERAINQAKVAKDPQRYRWDWRMIDGGLPGLTLRVHMEATPC